MSGPFSAFIPLPGTEKQHPDRTQAFARQEGAGRIRPNPKKAIVAVIDSENFTSYEDGSAMECVRASIIIPSHIHHLMIPRPFAPPIE